MNNTNEVEGKLPEQNHTMCSLFGSERYSRQHSLFTVSSLADASILLLGATPCGIEIGKQTSQRLAIVLVNCMIIAKNLGLSGVKSVSVWDCFPLQLTECSAMVCQWKIFLASHHIFYKELSDSRECGGKQSHCLHQTHG